LGHIVDKLGVKVNPKKLEVIRYWNLPRTLKCGFLGLTGCYRKFLNNYGNIVVPLISLLKNNSFT
jgi:hypothetical protein